MGLLSKKEREGGGSALFSEYDCGMKGLRSIENGVASLGLVPVFSVVNEDKKREGAEVRFFEHSCGIKGRR